MQRSEPCPSNATPEGDAEGILRFVKMQGAGNDYIYIDGVTRQAPYDPVSLAIRVSDRHKGIGSDGLVYLLPSETADVQMRMWNADGSEAEMCGNAIRCVAKLAYEKGIAHQERMTIETLAGIKTLDLTVANGRVMSARVDMGAPIFEAERIPVASVIGEEGSGSEDLVHRKLVIQDRLFDLDCVSMGNPHAIVFVEDVETFPVTVWGPLLERHPLFPRKANIEFVQVLGPDRVKARVWERGSGETQACGTGACAIAVVCATLGRTAGSVDIELPGGVLHIDWMKSGSVFLTGPCELVFEGTMEMGRTG